MSPIEAGQAEQIQRIVRARDWVHLKEMFEVLHPADLAEAAEDLSAGETLDLLEHLDRPQATEVFEFLSIERQQEMVEGLTRRRMAPFINEMAPDDRADLVSRLDPEVVTNLMPLLAAAERRDIKNLLQYEDDSAGAIMTTEYAAVRESLTVEECLQRLRQEAPDRETIYDIFVLDEDRKLVGLLTLESLILANPRKNVRDIMNENPVAVRVDEDREEVAEKVAHYEALALPVVDDRERLLGIVTFDDAMDVVEEEMTEDIYALGAAGKPPDCEYLQESVFSMAKHRVVWLMVLVVTGLVSALVLQAFKNTLERLVVLTFFVPLLCGSGGNAGSQSATVVIRGLSTGDLELADFLRVLRKEVAVGLIVGLVLAVLAALRAILVDPGVSTVSRIDFGIRLGLTVGFAMLGTITMAKALGASLPILFKRLGLDPALMSAPFITSVLDILSILIYLTLARFIVLPVLSP